MSVDRTMSRWRRLCTALRAHDPGLRAVKRSVRAAVLVPTVFALARALSSDPEVSLFAAFGSFGLLLMVDLAGTRAHRFRAYGALCVAGVAFIALGTVCSRHPVWAPIVMAIVAFLVLYAGVFSPSTAAASTGILLTFVLPVCVAGPPSQIPARLGGWLLASAICLPAVLLIWPGRWHDGLRRGLAEVLHALADATAQYPADPDAVRRRVEHTVGSLRDQFEQTPYPPTGSGPEDMVVGRLISRVEWLSTHALQSASDLHGDAVAADVLEVTAAAGTVLDALAAVVDPARGRRTGPDAVSRLAGAADALQRRWSEALAHVVESLVPGPGADGARNPDPTGVSRRPLAGIADAGFRARILAVVTLDAAQSVLQLVGVDITPGPAEALHQSVLRAQSTGQAIRSRIAAHATVASVWFRNSLRGAMALALAVGVVELTDVSHGFWVVLGTLSVLRSNALGTGASALRAVSGTLVGFVVGSAIMLGVGHHHVLLWVALPIAVLMAGVAPTLISFAAAQAGFTVTVIVLFNIIQPAGWHVGLVRVLDVAIGSGVSVAVGLLFWPRGASRSLLMALGRACSAYSWWFARSVELLGSDDPAGTGPEAERAVAAHYLLHEAFRQFLAERGAKPMSLPSVARLVAGADGIRLAASNLATLPPVLTAVDGAASEAVDQAHHAMSDACRSAAGWFDGLQAAIDGDATWKGAGAAQGGAVPTDAAAEAAVAAGRVQRPAGIDDETERRVGLLAAVDEVRHLARADEVMTVLRLLWADQGLEEQLRLQRRLREIYVTAAPGAAPATLG